MTDMQASGVKVMRPDPARLRYAFWQYGCAVFCDQKEKFGMTRADAAKWYRKLQPPPPAPWLEVNAHLTALTAAASKEPDA